MCSFFVTEQHNHLEDVSRVEAAQQTGCLMLKRISEIGSKFSGKESDFNFELTAFKDDQDQDQDLLL